MSFITNSPYRTTEAAVRLTSAPPKTKSWDPIPHGDVIDQVSGLIKDRGLEIIGSNFSLKDGKLDNVVIPGANMFGEIILRGTEDPEYNRVVGIRNSVCQDFPVAICGGEQVTVCDNMCFSGEFVVSHKHTSRVRKNLDTILDEALDRYLESFARREAQIKCWKGIEVDPALADHIIMEGRRNGAMVASKMFPILEEFENPRHDEFKDRTVWNLHNAYTEIQKTRECDPNQIATETIAMTDVLNKLFPAPKIRDAEVVLN